MAMGKEDQMYVRQVVKIDRRICARSRLVRDVRDLLRARSWAGSCQLIMLSQSRNLVQGTSVIKRSSSHSLAAH